MKQPLYYLLIILLVPLPLPSDTDTLTVSMKVHSGNIIIAHGMIEFSELFRKLSILVTNRNFNYIAECIFWRSSWYQVNTKASSWCQVNARALSWYQVSVLTKWCIGWDCKWTRPAAATLFCCFLQSFHKVKQIFCAQWDINAIAHHRWTDSSIARFCSQARININLAPDDRTEDSLTLLINQSPVACVAI